MYHQLLEADLAHCRGLGLPPGRAPGRGLCLDAVRGRTRLLDLLHGEGHSLVMFQEVTHGPAAAPPTGANVTGVHRSEVDGVAAEAAATDVDVDGQDHALGPGQDPGAETEDVVSGKPYRVQSIPRPAITATSSPARNVVCSFKLYMQASQDGRALVSKARALADEPLRGRAERDFGDHSAALQCFQNQ